MCIFNAETCEKEHKCTRCKHQNVNYATVCRGNPNCFYGAEFCKWEERE